MPSFPPVTSRALAILLAGAHRTAVELAGLAGLRPGTISAYLTGQRKSLSMENLFRFAAVLEIDPATVMDALLLASRFGPDAERSRPALVPRLGRLTEDVVAARLPRLLEEGDAREARQRAQELWQGMWDRPAADWRFVFTKLPRLVNWAACEMLAEQSEQTASDDADRALELAGLALWVAERVPGERPSRLACLAYARAFFGNALRVKSKLRGADEALDLALRQWQEAADAGCTGFLDGSRLLDLQASLRIDQRRLGEARELLAQAAAQAAAGLPLGRILIKEAYALELMGDYGGAVKTLEHASHLIPETEVRLRWVVQFNRMGNLVHVHRAAAAARMLPELRSLAARIDYKLDQVRLRWLEGRISAGIGRTREAVEALSWVRAKFADDGIRYDEALASTELAGLYLEQGRTADVKRLVRLMAPVFAAEGVHAEARKALGLFRRAVEMETVTVELVRRLVAYLYRAQHDPELRFEEETECA